MPGLIWLVSRLWNAEQTGNAGPCLYPENGLGQDGRHRQSSDLALSDRLLVFLGGDGVGHDDLVEQGVLDVVQCPSVEQSVGGEAGYTQCSIVLEDLSGLD